jgi:hypothetical protein
MPLSPTEYFRWYISRGNVFWRAFFVFKTIDSFFLPIEVTIECRITDESYADGRIPLGIWSVKKLLMKW